jgi:hypothetical protein
MIFSFFILACSEPVAEVSVRGQILTGRDTTVGAADVQITVRDGATKTYSSGTTNSQGVFDVLVPATSVIHFVLDGSAYVPTAFSALVGAEDVDMPVGELWMRTPTDMDDLRATFENCPNVDTAGAIVEGEVNYNVINQRSEERLIAEDATVKVFDNDGTSFTVCFLDNDGVSLDEPSAVGATGRFAAFALPPGPTSIQFSVPIEGVNIENFAFVYLPSDGVGPLYPALIEFP